MMTFDKESMRFVYQNDVELSVIKFLCGLELSACSLKPIFIIYRQHQNKTQEYIYLNMKSYTFEKLNLKSFMRNVQFYYHRMTTNNLGEIL